MNIINNVIIRIRIIFYELFIKTFLMFIFYFK